MSGAIFLDRDGVINEVLTDRVKFVNQPRDLYLLTGVGEAIRIFNELGYPVFVVTNQGGVGLGFMKEEELQRVHDKMLQELATFGASIDEVAYCLHKPHANCTCRKPEPGMMLSLAEKHGIDLADSYMVGDREPDIEAGKRAGTKTVFVGKRKPSEIVPDQIFPDLLSFAKSLK